MADSSQSSPFRQVEFGAGQAIFTEGEDGDVMYYVEQGQVRIWNGNPPSERTLSLVGRGGFFGEMALVDGKPRSANATAVEHVTLRAIPGSTLRRKLADTDPFVRALVRILVQNLRTTTEGTGGG